MRSEYDKTSDKKVQKEKKKKQRCRDTEQVGKDFTLATSINASSIATGKTSHCKNPSLITCYNCNKKGHYASQCIKPKKDGSKNEWQSQRPPCRWLRLVKRLFWSVYPVYNIQFNFKKIKIVFRLCLTQVAKSMQWTPHMPKNSDSVSDRLMWKPRKLTDLIWIPLG